MAQTNIFMPTVNILSKCRFFLNRVINIQLFVSNNTHSFVRDLRTDVRNRLLELNVPEKPKKPPNAYARFLREYQPIVAKEHSEWNPAAIFKKCAEDWRLISSEQKQKYVQGYQSERQLYDKHILEYNAKLTAEQREALKEAENDKKRQRENIKLRKLYKDTNKPKRPINAYMAYLLEESKMQNMSVKYLMLKLKGEWGVLPESQKEKYRTLAEKSREEYQKAMKQWEERMVKEGYEDLVRAKTLQQIKPSMVKDLQKLKPKSD